MNTNLKKSIIALMLALTFGSVQAAKLEESAGKAVLTNPDVLAKWHEFKGSLLERDVTWGRNLPTLDFIYGFGDERKSSPLLPAGTHSYSFNSAKLSLKQNIFEGLGVLNDTRRLEHASRVRYFELLDISETAALEATKAYIDLYRYRKLLEMAEENYATHRLVFNKSDERAKSGVGRGVDLEFAAGRLALAESNLLTEASNLHDVTARYQRIIGDMPKGEIAPPSALLGKNMPKSRNDAIQVGFDGSPQLKAAIENILSAQRNTSVQRAGYYPRLDLFADITREKNSGGNLGDTNTDTIGLAISYNFFKGMQDRSKISKAIEEANVAKDIRERVCRDLRQTLAISYNDSLKLAQQMEFLDQHQLSTDKAREALRRQFDIGQRTLLDLLDTENEFFTAKRNYVNGEMDLALAQARYKAASGNLLATLDLKPLEMDPPTPETDLDEDAVNNCPADPALYPEFDKEAYFNRIQAKETMRRNEAMQQFQPPEIDNTQILAPATNAAHVAPPANLAEHIKQDRLYAEQQSASNGHSIQLATIQSVEDATVFLSDAESALAPDRILVRRSSYGKESGYPQSRYVIYLGNYATFAAANHAIAQLPDKYRQAKPIIRSWKEIIDAPWTYE